MQPTERSQDMPQNIALDMARLKTRLRQLIEVESPSSDCAGVNRANDLVERWVSQMNATVNRHPVNNHVGDINEIRFPGDSRKPILLLGHLDTVWEYGTLAQMPYREAPDNQGRMRIWGPGSMDMKCGVVMAIEAMASLQAANISTPPVILLLNPDEEVGSNASRPYTEKLASECSAAFVLEPAQGIDLAAYKTARKGIGNYRIEVKGIAAHSGVDFSAGHSAVLELSRLLLKVATFTDLSIGLTVNPGVIGGGTRSNVIAADAWAEVDVRITRMTDSTELEKKLHALTCEDPACTVTITGGINRPPMERTPGTIALFEQAKAIAASLGFTLDEAATGGGSDGNFTSAIGIPTLDGMGAVGEGAHAPHESLLVEPLEPRTLLLARMIAEAK